MPLYELSGKDLISTQEWTVEEIKATLEFAKQLKRERYAGVFHKYLEGKTFLMLFYNTSTRTRVSFEAAATELGAHAQYLTPGGMRLQEGESVKDTAEVLARYGHGIGIRVLEAAVGYKYGRGNQLLRDYAKYSAVPIINMADDVYHPCQAMTDLMTIQEKFQNWRKKKFVFSWAYSTHARSWCSVHSAILLTTRFGMDVTLAQPPGFDLDPKILEMCQNNAKEANGNFSVTNDLKVAYNGADIIYPRSWMSTECAKIGIDKLGEDKEKQLHDKYKDWQCTMDLMQLTNKDSIFMHCLPVFRGEEATDEVVDSKYSVVVDQAENRLHTQKAIMSLTMR